jgi:hypothetical protein
VEATALSPEQNTTGGIIYRTGQKTRYDSRNVLEGPKLTCACLESGQRVHSIRNGDRVKPAQVEFLHGRSSHGHVSGHSSTRLPKAVRSRPLYIGKIFGNADETETDSKTMKNGRAFCIPYILEAWTPMISTRGVIGSLFCAITPSALLIEKGEHGEVGLDRGNADMLTIHVSIGGIHGTKLRFRDNEAV